MSIIQLEEFQQDTLLAFVKELELDVDDKLVKYLPADEETYSLDFVYEIMQKTNITAAQIANFGTPSPIRDKNKLQKAMGEVAKIFHRHTFSEREQIMLANPRNPAEKQAVIRRALGEVKALTEGVAHTEMYLRAAALYHGKLDYHERDVHIAFEYDIPKEQLKKLTGNKKWSDHENATPLQDLIEWTHFFKDRNSGRLPEEIHMSFSTFWDIVQCKSTVAAIKGISGGTVTPEEVNNHLRMFDVPKIVIQDGTINLESGAFKLLPVNRVAFLGLQGGGQLGSMVEGVTSANANRPGLYTLTWKNPETQLENIEVGKSAFTALKQPYGIMHIDVK